jgi:hypothetical protein
VRHSVVELKIWRIEFLLQVIMILCKGPNLLTIFLHLRTLCLQNGSLYQNTVLFNEGIVWFRTTLVALRQLVAT